MLPLAAAAFPKIGAGGIDAPGGGLQNFEKPRLRIPAVAPHDFNRDFFARQNKRDKDRFVVQARQSLAFMD